MQPQPDATSIACSERSVEPKPLPFKQGEVWLDRLGRSYEIIYVWKIGYYNVEARCMYGDRSTVCFRKNGQIGQLPNNRDLVSRADAPDTNVPPFRIGETWLTEGNRAYQITGFDAEFEYPWTARYMVTGYRYGAVVSFDKTGKSRDCSARLVRKVEQ